MSNLELIGGVSALVVISGLVHIGKMLGFPEKYVPVLTLILGLLASFAYYFYRNQIWYETLIMGLFLGLSSLGLNAGTKETVQAFRKQ
jgi:Flp pilus assembly protein protease CpaA